MQERTPVSIKASRLGDVLIITLLVESIHAGNAHWVKEEVLGYLKYLEDRHLEGVVLNLHNVQHIGHIGIGALIAINSQLRRFKIRAFMGLQHDVAALIHSSHLDTVFPLWHPDMNCPLCQQKECEHRTELVKKQTEFLSQNYPIDEKKQQQLNTEKVSYVYGLPLSASNLNGPMTELFFTKAEAKEKKQRLLLYGIAALLGVIILSTGLAVGYLAGSQNQSTDYRIPSPQEMLETYDLDGDGKITPFDGKALTFSQSTHLMHTPWCKPLGIPCVKSNKGSNIEKN